MICKERDLPGMSNMRHDELRALLSEQPDFLNVKPELQEVERRGHILLFDPKHHPECTCMFVKICWAHVKHYCRQHYGNSIVTLRKSLQYALSPQYLMVGLQTSFSEHTWRWNEAYVNASNGIAVYEALKALRKKHRQHRKGVHTTVPQ